MILSKKNWLAFLGVLSMLSIQSCVKEIDEYKTPSGNAVVTDMNQLQIPASFNYDVEKEFNVNINLLTSSDAPIPGVRVRIMTNTPENNGEILFTSISNSNGNVNQRFKLSKSIREVIINTDYIGLPNNALVNAQGNYLSVTLGGSNPQKISYVESDRLMAGVDNTANKAQAVPPKVFLGTWNSLGVPNYLATPKDVVSSVLLSRINQSLPEGQKVAVNSPQYIATNVPTAVSVNQTANLWMTFVHEGVNRRNTIGYYKYHKNNPPITATDIANIKIVYPNFSYLNSNGGLLAGDKVNIGSCGVDTMIGFVLLTNAYNTNSSTVGNGALQFYSNDALNPDNNALHRRHNILLWDPLEQKMVVGFEDEKRTANTNSDFNDAVFYITSSPANALSTSQINLINLGADTDGDGVADVIDNYPNNANMAYNNYYPGTSILGHLAFEDLWPYQGDYDMNDLIVGYLFNSIQNGNNATTRVTAKIFVKASGGSFKNGFGFELPFPPSSIQSVTGHRLTDNYIVLNANGTEAGQSKAVIIAFDNSRSLAPQPVGYYVNTQPGSPVVVSDTITLIIDFNTPIPMSTLGNAPFNPFMIINQERGKEIHLVNHPPTSLADPSLLGTGRDISNPALGIYYKSDINLPWCINIPENYSIVVEKNQIINAYLKFTDWVQSGGSSFPNWYQNMPGHIDPANVLNR